MDINSTIVAEYDYYTLDQARKIILAEQRRERKERIETYVALTIMALLPVMFIVDWLIFGY